jgi:hypothetical protein
VAATPACTCAVRFARNGLRSVSDFSLHSCCFSRSVRAAARFQAGPSPELARSVIPLFSGSRSVVDGQARSSPKVSLCASGRSFQGKVMRPLDSAGTAATGQCRHCGGRFFFFHLKAPPAFSPSPPSNPQTSAARTALGEIPTRVGGSPPRTSGTLSGTTSSGEGVGRAADPAKPARPSFCWVGVTPAGHQEWHKRCKPLRIRSRLRGEMENYGGWPRPCGWSKNHPPEVDIEGDRGRPA